MSSHHIEADKQQADKQQADKPMVMLTVDASRYSLTTIDLAVEIAASVQTRLHGLFIEDENLLRIADLPCTREITFLTAQERPTDVQQMQRSLRSMAEQFRKYLEQAANASQVIWSFDTVRGQTDDLGLKADLNAAYTVFDQSSSRRPESGCYPRMRRVLLIKNLSSNLLHALKVVLHRFKNQKVEITVITDKHNQAAAPIAKLLPEIEKTQAGISMIEMEREQLLNSLPRSETAFDCAIISHHEAGDLREILNSIKCPVILVS